MPINCPRIYTSGKFWTPTTAKVTRQENREMANVHAEWQELTNRLNNATSDLEATLSIYLARKAAGGPCDLEQIAAIRTERQRVNNCRLALDQFLDQHIARRNVVSLAVLSDPVPSSSDASP
jgi:hypothetical protein